jgi:hypothetical protein
MPVIKKVVLVKNQTCEKCKKEILAGNTAVKDRRDKIKGTRYFHPEHVK